MLPLYLPMQVDLTALGTITSELTSVRKLTPPGLRTSGLSLWRWRCFIKLILRERAVALFETEE